MDTVIENGLLKPLSFHDVKAEQENSYKITGNNPFIVFDLSKYNLSGKKAGLMKFDFTCKPQFHEPRIQIYWTGEEGVVQEKNSLFFTANNGTLLIPIDSAPRWYLLNEIKSIRIRLFNAEACETISIKNLSLHQRN
jgi:hypothetical protein